MIRVLRRPGTEGVLLIYPETNPHTKEMAQLVAVAVRGYEEHEVAQIIAADLLKELGHAESWRAGPGTILQDALSRLEPITVQGGVSVSCAVCIRKGQMVQTATCGEFTVLLLRPQRSGFLKGRELTRNEITENTYGLAAQDTMIVVSRPLLDELTGDELTGILRSFGVSESVDRIDDRLRGVTFSGPQAIVLSAYTRDLPPMHEEARRDSRIAQPVDMDRKRRIPIRAILIPAATIAAIIVAILLIRNFGLLERGDGHDETIASIGPGENIRTEPDSVPVAPARVESTVSETHHMEEAPAVGTVEEESGEIEIPAGDPGDLQWKVKIGGSNFSSSPTVAGRKLYVGSKDTHLYCLSTTSGEIIWKFRTNGGIGSSPTFTGEYLCFGSYDSTFYCINRHSGERVWERKVRDRIVSSPSVHKGIVYCGSDDHSVYAWRLGDGAQLWRHTTGGVVWAKPVVQDDRVFFGSLDGFCYCVDARSGDLIWKYPAGGKIYAAASPVDDKRVVFASAEGAIFMLDSRSGKQVWEQNYGEIYSTPLVYENLIYFGSKDGTFHCLTVDNGNQIWSMATTKAIRSSPVIMGSTVYFGGYDGKLYALNRDNGEKIWEYDTKSRIYSTPSAARGSLFFGDLTGWLHALNASQA